MNPDLEALFRLQLAALPQPAGIPPASINPKVIQAGQAVINRIMEIMLRFTVVSPTIPPPPPPGPMASMDAADLQVTTV